MVSDDRAFSLMTAVDVLDALAAGQPPSLALLLRGTLVLAQSCTPTDESVIEVVRDLERLVLGEAELNGAGRDRAASMASALRRSIGVH